jgi:hypothetical protein
MINKNMAIHVPLEARLFGYNGPLMSIGIINDAAQMLFTFENGSYSVFQGMHSENTGSNYFLGRKRKPKTPKRNPAEGGLKSAAGKLFFATDYEEDDEKFKGQLKSLENYVLFIDDSAYVSWKPVSFPSEKEVFEVQRCRTWYFNSWKFFYEVKKRETK